MKLSLSRFLEKNHCSGSTTGQSHPLQSKRDGDEKEDGADGAGLVEDQEVGGVEEQ